MQFISNGDFIFPFEVSFYWLKHFYIWSFQTGALNLDGIIRIPGRLLEIGVFQLFGNIIASYFYLFFCFALVFISFYVFCRYFLRLKQKNVSVIAALIVTFNPVFLGNTSKIGLVLAAGLLPLCLVWIKEMFVRQQPAYLIGLIITLNISFLHPFNMAVNALISFVYLGYLSWKNRSFVKKHALKLVGIVVLGVAMHAYILLPIAQLGTIDKGAIMQDVSDAPIDYTALVEVANTGNLLTSLSLSKDVFKDYDFYNSDYQVIYFVATLAFYLVLLCLYSYVEKQLGKREKIMFVLLSFGALGLLLLSTGTVFNIDAIIKYLIEKPGGWTFRSPLKWQLYIPFFLFSALFLLLRYVKNSSVRRLVTGGLVVIFVGATAFLGAQIFQRLLVPRTIVTFKPLMNMNLTDKRVLYVSNTDCTAFAGENAELFTELNQVFISKDVQLKHIGADMLPAINITNYDYVLSCQQSADESIAKNGLFTKQLSFVDDGLSLFKNNQPPARFYAFGDLFELGSTKAINDKRVAVGVVNRHLQYIVKSKEDLSMPVTELVNPFETITADTIRHNQLINHIETWDGNTTFILQAQDKPLFFKLTSSELLLQTNPATGFTRLTAGQKHYFSKQTKAGSLKVVYNDPNFTYQNAVKNASFEQGLWQQNVSDCNNYDEQPKLSMSQDTSQASAGKASLLLEAARHTACTSPKEKLKLGAGKRYLLSFDYNATINKAGYYLGFEDKAGTSASEVVRPKKDEVKDTWHHYSTIIAVPEDSQYASLQFYGYPGTQGKLNKTHYDNVKLVAIPEVSNVVHVLSEAPKMPQIPTGSTFVVQSPTKSVIRVKGAKGPFYLAMNDTYHSSWQASTVPAGWLNVFARPNLTTHMALNGDMNGWYVDPAKDCGPECKKNADGSYDLTVYISFKPQQSLMLGLLISFIAWVIGIYFLLRHIWQQKRVKRGHSSVY